MVELSVEEWIHETLQKKGYIRKIEDRDDFIEKTGCGATKFNKWMKNHGLRFDRGKHCWVIDDNPLSRGDHFHPPSAPSSHIELLNYRWIWDQIQQTPSLAEAARETNLSYNKLNKINSMLEEYWVEGHLENWLRVTEKLLGIQIQRGGDHKTDRLMLELRQVFVEYVRDPENHDPPTNEDIEWIYQELLKDFSSLQNANHSNSDPQRTLTEIEGIINESGKQNFPKNQGAWGSFEKACGTLTTCGWKMGMCKSSSGKDNAINRMYTTGVIRAYPQVLIQCLFIDDFLEEISEVYKNEFGEKMRCSPIMVLVSENENHNWRPIRVLVQDKHPLLPLNRKQIRDMFPLAEIVCTETASFEITEGWIVEEEVQFKSPKKQLIANVIEKMRLEIAGSKRGYKWYNMPGGEVIHLKYSKFYERDKNYWYGITPASLDYADEYGITHFGFIIGVEGCVIVDIEVMKEYVKNAKISPNPDSTVRHYHLFIKPKPRPCPFHWNSNQTYEYTFVPSIN